MHRDIRSFLLVVLTPLIGAALLFGALYIYDPLQLFHKPWFRANTVQDNVRLQAAGLLNNYDFDSIIIGNSHSENTSPRVAQELFGGRFFNLSMSGSGHYERSFVIEAFLRKKNARMIIDQADYFMTPDGGKLYWLDSYTYLYDDKKYNDFLAYLNARTLRCLATFSTSPKCVGGSTEYDRPAAWANIPYNASRFGGLDVWVEHHENDQLVPFFEAIKKFKPASSMRLHSVGDNILRQFEDQIERFFLGPARAHPEVRFVYLDVPFSTLYDAMRIHNPSESWSARSIWLKMLVEKTSTTPNIEIYGFSSEPFKDDIANYKDETHFHEDINTFMLTAVSRGQNRLTSANIDSYIEAVLQKAWNYDMAGVKAQVEEGLARLEREKAASSTGPG